MGRGGARVDHVDTALETRVEVALPSATGKHLRLDNELILAKRLGDLLGLLRGKSGQSLGRGDTVLPRQFRAAGAHGNV